MNRENDYVRNVVMAANDDLCDLKLVYENSCETMEMA